jgi:biopolymer transport protein ExbD
MSKHHIPDSHTAHPNVTPLIDIIMCLIIFFMLVARIGVTTGAQKIDIPSSAIGSKIKDMGNTLTLNIPDELRRDIDVPVVTAFISPPGGGEKALTNLSMQDPVTGQNQVLNVLKMYKSQNENFKVIIRARADLDWRYIAPVLDVCNEAGVRSINFNTKKVSKS